MRTRGHGFGVFAVLACLGLGAGCEDGPSQIFQPNHGDLQRQNGDAHEPNFVQPGVTGWDFGAGRGDSIDRARFCDQSAHDERVRWMVTQPIVPNQSSGGVPLWAPSGAPMGADDLIGMPENNRFCDPAVYSTALAWGAYNEVVVFFNQDTRLVESVRVNGQYRGTFDGTYTKANGQETPISIRMHRRVQIAGEELDMYTSSADEASNSRAWLNHANITAMYSMVRETYFGASPVAEDYNCVEDKICDIIYTSEDQSVPQQALVVFKDSGVTLVFAPEGQVLFVILEPVRVAPFESKAEVRFADQPGARSIMPRFTSNNAETCDFQLGQGMTWGDFVERCMGEGEVSQRLLRRFNYEVGAQRDSVMVAFNGITLGFMADDANTERVFRDGARPEPQDRLFSMSITRTLNAPMAEFEPMRLALMYKSRLERVVRGAVDEAAGIDHPFLNFTLDVPTTLQGGSQRIGELWFVDADGQRKSWVSEVLLKIQAMYRSLDADDRAMVDASIVEGVTVVEPFVDVVLSALTHGVSDEASTHKTFRTTDNMRWSIASAHFFQDGEPWRVNVQYSLYYGAVTFVGVDVGYSPTDNVLNDQFAALQADGLAAADAPYMTADLFAMNRPDMPVNGLGLHGMGIKVLDADRELRTVDIEVSIPVVEDGERGVRTMTLTVPGAHKRDRSGYYRQLRGERVEFVPAHYVRLGGQETVVNLYIEEDEHAENGVRIVDRQFVGRVSIPAFKGSVELCPGLSITYGDDVRAKLRAWKAAVGGPAFQSCEIAYNYSANGNVLDGVASLKNRINFSTVGGRATTVTMWR